MIFLFVIIFYLYGGERSVLKDALSMTASFFGGIATLVAAYIATQLFNDWRIQHNKQVLANEAKGIFQLFHNQRDCIHKLKYRCEDIFKEKKKVIISWSAIAKEYDRDFVALYNTDKDKMSSFCFLSEGQLVYDLTMDYYKEIAHLSSYLTEKRDKQFSETTFLDEELAQHLFNLLKNLEDKNTKILNELKTYIFVKSEAG